MDNFQNDEDFSEEETLLYVEIDSTSMAEEQLRKITHNFKIFGFDSQQPLLQISNRFFQGEFDSSMGTHVFLEKVEPSADDLYCKCENYYNFAAKSSKLLKVSRVLLKDKAPESMTQPEKDLKDMKNQLKVALTYEGALNKLLAEGRTQPRNISRDFNAENLFNIISGSAENAAQGRKIEES